MWELIRANKRKSFILISLMGTVLLLLGYVIGEFYSPGAGFGGMAIAFFVWAGLALLSYYSGDSILLMASKAKEVTHEVHPQLYNVVEEMKIAANLPKMPKIYIINEEAPNAFATGRSPDKAAVAVTAGLLSRLNRDELQGVIAHEIAHINNRDILYVTMSGVMLGAVVLISQVFLRSLWFTGGHSRRYRSRDRNGGGQAQMIMMVVAIAFAILAPIMAQLLYFALSRKREYLADATGARLTRYPEGLASALEKISKGNMQMKSANKVTAPMYIINPLADVKKQFSSWTSTHPPTEERIRILRNMMHGVNYKDYQDAYSKIKGKSDNVIPASGLKDQERIDTRTEGQPAEKTDDKKQKRDLGDLMRKLDQYAFIACACGLRMKVPPEYKKDKVKCPRCGKDNKVPPPELVATASAAAEAVDKSSRKK
ncbi:MAG: M48 family metalloprotease [candidate division Zixibacteria bacterium]|nr:M48 family metalloprotease [candidate division Zixibacteria bacterium]